MARPRPVPGIDPDGRLRPNARRILAVRIDEVWSYDRAVRSPGNVRELHDMRICFKRLRYLLEIFAVAFGPKVDALIDEIREMQDLLGDIHDRDVEVPRLQHHLDDLARREAAGARAAVLVTPPAGTAPDEIERAFHEFAERLDAASAHRLRPGLTALLDRRTRERDELYARFLAHWVRWERDGFRDRMGRILGISAA